MGDLARSFNGMSLQLRAANEEIVTWTKTLEDRVEQKTTELKRAHEHVLHVERMASIGKMAAVVAHEVNNPLSGILTYAKLMRKWVGTRPSRARETRGGDRMSGTDCHREPALWRPDQEPARLFRAPRR